MKDKKKSDRNTKKKRRSSDMSLIINDREATGK